MMTPPNHLFVAPLAFVVAGASLLLGGCATASKITGMDPSLKESIQFGDVRAIDFHLRRGVSLEPDCPPKEFCNPLAFAALRGEVKIVQKLLDADANPNIKGPLGDTAFMVAGTARPRTAREIRMMLLDYGTDPNQPNDYGITPFMGAAMTGDIEMMELALLQGADVNAVFRSRQPNSQADRNSALIWAVKNNHTAAVKWLLDHQADPMLKNGHNQTARDLAKHRNNMDIILMLEMAMAPTATPPTQ